MEDVYLSNQHLIITADLLKTLNLYQTHILVKFNFEKKELWLTAPDNQIFKITQKAFLKILKIKNLNNDRAVAIQDILIDNEINEDDRRLNFIIDEGILKISL